MKNATKIASFLVLLFACIALPACNTTKGVGKDIKSAGEGLENSASRNGAD